VRLAIACVQNVTDKGSEQLRFRGEVPGRHKIFSPL
jgi:hypothetical protein